MAIVHVNGFGTIPEIGDYVHKGNAATGTSTWTRETGRYGGYALRHRNSTAGSGTDNIAGRLESIGNWPEISIGLAVNHRSPYAAQVHSNIHRGFGFVFGSDYSSWVISMGTGATSFSTDPAIQTSIWSVVDNTATSIGWHWWNLVFRYAASPNGICRLYRDGTLLLTAETDTYQMSGAPNLTYWRFWMGNDNGGAQIDVGDLIVKNDASIIPESVVTTLFPNGNGPSSEWMGSDSNNTDNYQLVNEQITYNPATYVSSSTVNATDSYAVENLTNNASSIHAVQTSVRALKTEVGARTISAMANNQAGTARDPGSQGAVYALATTSDGSTPWNNTSVNAMTAGVRVVS